MRILALSGWGQAHDALKNVVPPATHLDYAQHANVDIALADIASVAAHHDAVVGWSLGGQLLVRAVAQKRIAPKKMVLIAPPFQFVETPEKPLGMKRDQFEKFRGNYAKNAPRTLAKAWELVAKDDAHEPHVRAHSERFSQTAALEKNWLYWLDALEHFSCASLDFSDFPATLLLHGEKDVVVEYAQAHAFLKHIPHAKHISLPHAGHAPHWHDDVTIRAHIQEFLDV